MLADLLIEQVEFANVIVVNKTDLVDEKRLATLEAALRKLNPEARVLRASRGAVDAAEILNTGLFDEEAASAMPGWAKELNGEHTPETEAFGISSFVYRARRPFHPERFMRFIEQGTPGLLRSKGYIWLATRMDVMGLWSQAGSSLQVGLAGTWFAATDRAHWPEDPETLDWVEAVWETPYGDRRQEIVFIGQNMDMQALSYRLQACLLSDAEMAKGPKGWRRFRDPFPRWRAEPAEV